MKLIKFHTSFITPCFLPFANLSKSSFLHGTGKEVHFSAHKPKKRAFGCLEIGRRVTRCLTSLLVHHHLEHEAAKPQSSITGFSSIKGALEKGLEAGASNWDLIPCNGCLAHLCVSYGVQHNALTQLVSFNAKQVSPRHKLYLDYLLHIGVTSELVNSLGAQLEFHPTVCILSNQTKA